MITFRHLCRSGRSPHKLLLLLSASATLAAVLTSGAGAAPTPFELFFDGAHDGHKHAGPFTASAPFCSAGKAEDLRDNELDGTAMREYTCDDGSGTLVLQVENYRGEHETGGTGAWKILSGTGRYKKLRGSGTWTCLSWAGDPNNELSMTFRTRMQGTADLDLVAPTVNVSRANATKLAKPAGAYRIKLVLVARDPEGGTVSVRARALAGSRLLGSQTGGTSSGAASLALTVRPPRSTRTISLAIAASDAVGNVATATASLKLPR